MVDRDDMDYIKNMAKDVCRLDRNCDKCNMAYGCKAIDYATRFYNAHYRKQEWISVDERLPTEEEYRDEYGELIPILVCEKDTRYPYRAMYDGTEWGDGLMKIRGITHWMPLPMPPKGDEGK